MKLKSKQLIYAAIWTAAVTGIVFGMGCKGPAHAARIKDTYTMFHEVDKAQTLNELWIDLAHHAPQDEHQWLRMAENASELNTKRIDMQGQLIRYMYEDNPTTMNRFLRENEEQLRQLHDMNESFKRQLLEKIYPDSSAHAGM